MLAKEIKKKEKNFQELPPSYYFYLHEQSQFFPPWACKETCFHLDPSLVREALSLLTNSITTLHMTELANQSKNDDKVSVKEHLVVCKGWRLQAPTQRLPFWV
jgi:hypothetical protein